MPEWYEDAAVGVSAEDVAHVKTKGWDLTDPAKAFGAAVKAYRGVETLIGHPADQVLKLPKDATDPGYQAIYNRVVDMGMPKSPDEYKFDDIKYKDGTALDPADATFMRDLAVKYKLPTAAVRGIVADMTARADTRSEGETAMEEAAKAANQTTLRAAWGSEYDIKANAATQAAAAVGFTPDVLAGMAALPPADYVKNMNALVFLGVQMQEARRVGGGGVSAPFDPSAGLTPTQARTTLTEKQQDPEWRSQVLKGAEPAFTQWKNLTAAASGPAR